MTDVAAWIQAISAIVVGGCTIYFGFTANRLLKLQVHSQVEPAVSIDLFPWIADGPEDPLCHIKIVNHSPVRLYEVQLSAEVYDTHGATFTADKPGIIMGKVLPDLPSRQEQPWCVDQLVEAALKYLNIELNGSTLRGNQVSVFMRLHLRYRRGDDGSQFTRSLLVGLYKLPEFDRAFMVYPSSRVLIDGPDS